VCILPSAVSPRRKQRTPSHVNCGLVVNVNQEKELFDMSSTQAFVEWLEEDDDDDDDDVDDDDDDSDDSEDDDDE